MAEGVCARYDGSRVWIPEIVERIALSLSGNEVPCSLRLVNKATAQQFQDRAQYTNIRLSQPVPPHAFAQRWGLPGAFRSLTYEQRRQLLRLTAASGSVTNLKLAVALVGGPSVLQLSGAFKAAAAAGQLEVCEWLLQQGCSASLYPAIAAAQEGQKAAIELLFANGVSWHWDIVYAAAHGGHTELMDWLLLRRPEGQLAPTSSLEGLGGNRLRFLLVCAAQGCDLTVLQSLYRRGFESQAAPGSPQPQPLRRHWYEEILESAARSPVGDWRAKIEWLESKAPPNTVKLPAICSAAAHCSNALDRLTWLQSKAYPLSTDVAWVLGQTGDVAGLEHVLAAGIQPDEGLGTVTASAGRLAVLQLLRSRGTPFEPLSLVTAAATIGHLPVVAWAVEELGIAVSDEPRLMDRAALSGNVQLISWLHGRGYTYDVDTFRCAADSGKEEALEWLAERDCPMGDDGKPYQEAARKGDLYTLRVLQRLGCPWGPVGRVFTACVEWCVEWNRPLPALRCLVDMGCPVDWDAAVKAAARKSSGDGRTEVQTWLEAQLRQQHEAKQG